jgi:hypothetical protein
VALARSLTHHPTHICRPLGQHAHVRIGFFCTRRNDIDVHDDWPRLALPRRQDGCRNRTGPCPLNHKARDAGQRFGSFQYASLVVCCPAACGSEKRYRSHDGAFLSALSLPTFREKASTRMSASHSESGNLAEIAALRICANTGSRNSIIQSLRQRAKTELAWVRLTPRAVHSPLTVSALTRCPESSRMPGSPKGAAAFRTLSRVAAF